MTTLAVNIAAHSGGPQQRKVWSSCSAPRTSSAVPSPPINIGGEGEGASRASRPTPSACAGRRPTRSRLCCCRGPAEGRGGGGGGGRRRVSLSTAATSPASSLKTNTNTTNARPTLSCTGWAIDSGRRWPSGTRVLPPPPPPRSGGGGRDRAARGIVDAVTVAVAVARRRWKKIPAHHRHRRHVAHVGIPCTAMHVPPDVEVWSEFYHHRRGNSKSTNDQDNNDNDDNEGATHRRKRRRTTMDNNNPSSFASHNIPLLADDDAALPDQLLRQSNLLFEQVTSLVHCRLARRFPDIVNATSIEVWCH